MKARVLILGGTAEARRLAESLSESWDVTTSLAGRTTRPRDLPGRVRVGGFGGGPGLTRYLVDEGIAVLIDATHPYAARMGWNAAAASQEAAVPMVRLERPPWEVRTGDNWHCFQTLSDLVTALPRYGAHALITLGGADLAAFAQARTTRLTIRAIDPPDPPLEHPNFDLILSRGPFDLHGESTLLSERGIDMVVSRNAGGEKTSAKLDAARALGLPVLMLQRPRRPETDCVDTVDDALAWIGRRVD